MSGFHSLLCAYDTEFSGVGTSFLRNNGLVIHPPPRQDNLCVGVQEVQVPSGHILKNLDHGGPWVEVPAPSGGAALKR